MIDWIKKFRRKYFVFFDTVLSVLLGVGFFYTAQYFNLFSAISDESISSLLGVSTSLLGFLIAVMAIIFTFKDGPKLETFQNSDKYSQVIDIYISAIIWTALLSIGFLLVIIIDLPFQFIAGRELIVSLFLSFAIVKIWRCIWITKEMFELSISNKK